ncbi:hypothetical protein CRG98_044887 [Punica granatum]|uniref:Uncharacterized protein n=1 Tax=Punica granatum TaxID=22663 RepID=A0A2I0HSK9_PUNGR|nr:hypothetical protein CRG98_044887 [Punica granatum]
MVISSLCRSNFIEGLRTEEGRRETANAAELQFRCSGRSNGLVGGGALARGFKLTITARLRNVEGSHLSFFTPKPTCGPLDGSRTRGRSDR